MHLFSIKTAGQRHYELAILPEPGHPQGDHYFSRRNGDEAECRDLRTSVDYAHRQVKASIPRACLGKPRWVRAGGGEGSLDGDVLSDQAVTLFVDDANRTGRSGDDSEATLTLGPRVRRG